MRLEKISLKDFRCFSGEHSIIFSTDEKKNVTLIHAENGVGKTTILNAMLWCFYDIVTAKFERRHDLVNHDAVTAGRTTAYVEVLFEHNGARYRARRYAGSTGNTDRTFSISRLDKGHSMTLPNPDTFINTVIPKTMATHFLFDGEHAEVFLGEENRSGIRKAVQDILGCNLIDTAIKDLENAAVYYRKQMPKAKASATIDTLSGQIDAISSQIETARGVISGLQEDAAATTKQIADIDEKLRNSVAAKELQGRRESIEKELTRARKRVSDAHEEVLKWLGDNGRFLVSTKLTEQTFDHLETQETKGRLPSPYNEEFVKDLLDLEACICGTILQPGSEAYVKVSSLLRKAANHTLRSRLNGIRAIISQMKMERERAPGRLDASNKRQVEARADVSSLEAQLADISRKLEGINLSEISQREKRRNELRTELNEKNQEIGVMRNRISSAETDKAEKERELKRQAENDKDTKIFVTRYELCESLKDRLTKELVEEEKSARDALRFSIGKVLSQTGRKNFRLQMTNEYGISLVNDTGTHLAKSGGENQLLGLAFTAALVQFAKIRQNAKDDRLLKGTEAPLVLDSPFGQLDDTYGLTTVKHVPEMAGQVVLMISSKQSSGGVLESLQNRIGREYVLVRNNRDPRGKTAPEIRQFRGKDIETAIFDAPFDGTSIVELS
jgi:DNA sulfur modification protein DndD